MRPWLRNDRLRTAPPAVSTPAPLTAPAPNSTPRPPSGHGNGIGGEADPGNG